MNYKKLKSGTDIRGIAVETSGKSIELTDETVAAISRGFVGWLCDRTGKEASTLRIGVGRDCRISGERIDNAVSSAMSACGAKVIRAGMSSTPAMFMMTLGCELDGAVQITASHHPFDRNGLKFFTPQGGLEGEDISDILRRCEEGLLPGEISGGSVEEYDFMPEYASQLREKIKSEVAAEDYDRPLAGYRIVVDAGNGVGGFYVHEVLAPLGADITGSRYLEPDGMFPNHAPNPENAEAMRSVREAVLESGAQLGLIFDTDVDRAGVVDSQGEEINRNRLIALSAAIAMRSAPGATIVTDSTTSAGLREFIENTLGGKHYRYRRGYRNVINRAIELNAQGIECPLAIETSGHAALKENYFLDDGAYLVTKIIIEFARMRAKGLELSTLIEKLPMPLEEKEVRLPLTGENFAKDGARILASLEDYAAERPDWIVADDNREGLRVTLPSCSGWFLLRLSVHDPIMPVNLESDEAGGCDRLVAELYGALANESDIDLSPLQNCSK